MAQELTSPETPELLSQNAAFFGGGASHICARFDIHTDLNRRWSQRRECRIVVLDQLAAFGTEAVI